MASSQRTALVVGLGYIGLPTAILLATHGWQVYGFDTAASTVERVNAGELPFVEDGLDGALREAVDSGRLRASTTPCAAEVIIIAVPTPFTDDHRADLSYIDSATAAIAPHLRAGDLVILESTSPVGTTEHVEQLIAAARPDLWDSAKAGTPPILVAHAPERVLPGRIMVEMASNDRIVGGTSPEATERAREVYATFCTGTIHRTDARTAELSKLAENTFRDINIAYANELSTICADLDIDVWELIELANMHPRVNILQPGPGVGGHCIAVDPWFIVSAVPSRARLIRTAREVNDAKPDFVLAAIEDALGAGESTRVSMFGLAFKPDIDDLRESPALDIARRFVDAHPDVDVVLVEPNITTMPACFAGKANVTLERAPERALDCDVAVQLVNHRDFADVPARLDGRARIIDTRGTWSARQVR